MLLYLSVFAALIIFALLYSKVARIYNIVDVPNERSSHTFPIVRGGGILFFCAAMMFFFSSDYQYPGFILGLTILSILSFTDDILTLKARIRLPFQFLAIFFILSYFQIEFLPTWILICISIVAVGFINIYNFMDGINGITGLYSLAVLQGFWILDEHFTNIINGDLLLFTSFSLVIFGYFNFRKKAKFFAGDVGSISLAAIILFIGFKFIVVTGSPLILGLVVVYGIDSGITILRRLLSGQNIFKPHRQHLYQHLVDKKKISHLKVAFGYAGLQIILNYLIYISFSFDIEIQYLIFAGVILVLSVIYFVLLLWTKDQRKQSIAKRY